VTLAKRIIPCLDVRDGRVVKSVRFVDTKDAGDAIELATRYERDGADELVFLDINASHEKRRTVVEFASVVADRLFIPFTVGGGIDSADLAGEILRVGADKVAINSAAVRDPRIITGIANRYGSQATVLSIDARRARDQGWEVVLDGGRVPTGLDALAWVREGIARGAGEVLLNSIDHDGTRQGFDLALTEAVASAVDVPVIASGGASSATDFVELFRKTGAEAGLAASIFHYGELTVGGVKDVLAAAGIPVRPRERAFA
jgi:cyclase